MATLSPTGTTARRDTPEAPSPSSSSLRLSIGPFGRRSRRGSKASLSSHSQIDKDVLSLALDQIHTSASRSETLTTFDEFAPPPHSTSGPESKTIGADLVQGGLSGLYNRLRATVGGARDANIDSAGTLSNDSSEDLQASKRSARSISKIVKSPTSTIVSSPVVISGPSSRIQSPSTSSFPDEQRQHKSADVFNVASSKSTSMLSKSPFVPQPKSRPSFPTVTDHASQNVSREENLRSQAPPNGQVKGPNASTVEPGQNVPHFTEELSITPSTSQTVSRPSKPGPEADKNKPGPQALECGENITPIQQDRPHSSLPTGEIAVSSSDPEASLRQRPTDSSVVDESNPVSSGAQVVGNKGQLNLPRSRQESTAPPIPPNPTDYATDVVRTTGEVLKVQPKSPTTPVPQRPPLLHISPSHLPGFRPSRASSSDGGLSSITASVAPPRQSNVHAIEEEVTLSTNRGGVNLPYNAFSHTRRKILSKEFWMRDENAKDCFNCGDAFSTFRRKHHCRTCGQIFDAKCTSLISGKLFGQNGTLRVCKPCEAIIQANDDDSSVYSEDIDRLSVMDFEADSTNDNEPPGNDELNFHGNSEELSLKQDHTKIGTPTISIPMSRKPGEKKGRSAVIEMDEPPVLARPNSSRSLRSLSGRPRSSSHKRHHSRHQHMRSLRGDERAPFQSFEGETGGKKGSLPVFHHDNIIDPELAPFMSDEDSSEDEQASIFTTMNRDAQSGSAESDKNGFSSLFHAIKKGRSRAGDRSVGGGPSLNSKEIDNSSLAGRNVFRHSRRRNLSAGSFTQPKPSPRRSKSNSFLRSIGVNVGTAAPQTPVIQPGPFLSVGGSRTTRSASMRGSQAPTVELNQASLQHVKKLLKQMLQDASLSNVSSWEKALMPILLQCTDDVNPDVNHSDDIDIRNYIKLKKVPGGKPGDTSYVSGVVFTKNLALKSMPRNIPHPCIIIVTFPIEYARHQQHFMSLEPVIAQEREYLRNLIGRVAALRPHLLLVQKNVSGLALKFLEEANIAVAYNVKPSVLNAVARCTQTRMISSVDKLAIDPSYLGRCESFDVRTYVFNGIKKTYIYLSGCQPDLGCTVVLRGADTVSLGKLKRITEFMCYVVYNLKLETCLMRDEFVLIPTNTNGGTLSPAKPKRQDEGVVPSLIAESYGGEHKTNHNGHGEQTVTNIKEISSANSGNKDVESQHEKAKLQDTLSSGTALPKTNKDMPSSSFYGHLVEKHETKILSASPFVKFMQPYLLMQAREQERRVAYLKGLKDQYGSNEDEKDGSQEQQFNLVQPEMVHSGVGEVSKQVRDFLHAVHNAEYDKALHNYQTQKRQWETYLSSNTDLFDPMSHQKIAVLYSMVNSVTSTPCVGPEIIALEFYHEHNVEEGFAADCTLGQYVEDLAMSAALVCDSAGCDRRMSEHHRQYVHGEGQLSVLVQKHPPKIRGLQNTVLMWSCCRICGQETQAIPMSENTWKYSFAKYLELSFWCSELHPRASVCPHDIHRDHVRYFGFNNVAIRFQYDKVQLYEIIVPRPTVTWKVDKDLRLKNEQFSRIEERLDRFMTSVKTRLKCIRVDAVVPEKAEACKAEVGKLIKRANEEHDSLRENLQDKYMSSRYYEIVPLNRAIRAIQEKAISWDEVFVDFEKQFFPSEKDIRRLAVIQMKKMFLEKDESATSISSVDEAGENFQSSRRKSEGMVLSQWPSQMSPEKARDVLTSVVEEDHNTNTLVANVGQHISDSADQSIDALTKNVSGNASDQIQKVDLSTNANDKRKAQLADNVVASHDEYNSQSQSQNPPESHMEDSSGGDTEPSRSVESSQELQTKGEPSDSASNTFVEDELSSIAPTSESHPESKIPRLVEASHRSLLGRPLPLSRAHSQPNNIVTLRQVNNASGKSSVAGSLTSSDKTDTTKSALIDSAKALEKRVTERLGLTPLKATKSNSHSMIPRSVPRPKDSNRVSTLAKHFEQLSREFEKERLKERRQRAERSRQARAYPLASSRPIIEVYKDVHEAVQERHGSDEDLSSTATTRNSTDNSTLAESSATEITEPTTDSGSPSDQRNPTSEKIKQLKEYGQAPDLSHHVSDAEADGSDVEHGALDEIDIRDSLDDSQLISPTDSQLDLSLELPKHEKTSLMRMLSSFWSERSASGWVPLEYPFAQIEHVWEDSDIIVREDEPSSIIALALSSPDYLAKLQNFRSQQQSSSRQPRDTHGSGDDTSIERNLLHKANMNIRYGFTNRGVRAQCKIFYAQSFDALRRKCGVADRFVESLSRCLKWDSKGGKTKSLFLKTLDDRFVLKSLSAVEVNSFVRFAPNYFNFIHQNLFKGLPSVIAKMFGLFQVQIKSPTGRDFDCFMLVMENLFYDREPNRRFDLKGSMRNRKIQSTGERDEVLLDENLVDIIYSETPIFVREHTKKLLNASVWNDTLFLSQQNVMDYSLMAGFDDPRREIVVGIIDCIRTYTWDKKLETWIKDRGKNKPTITSPKDYRSRFRVAMAKYILQAPNCWHQFRGQQIQRRTVRLEGKKDGEDGEVEAEVVEVGVVVGI